MLSESASQSVKLIFISIVSLAVLACAQVTQTPRQSQASRALKLFGGGISSYSLGSDHLELRVPVNCTPDTLDIVTDVYNLRAPFHILYVQINFLVTSETKDRQCRISHGDFDLKARVANFSLGLGPNSLTFLTQQDGQLPRPTDTGRRIQLHIRRLERPQLRSVQTHGDASELRVCRLIQDCDFIQTSGAACGLGPAPTAVSSAGDNAEGWLSWPRWLKKRRDSLPVCSLEQLAEGASWHIPCTSCDAPETCAWRLARWWHPDCLAEYPALEEVRKRLDGVRIVFLGDSTLRGLMFSLYKLANGSLHRWEKSHHTLLLSGRDGRVRMDFSYYPQFWLRAGSAPGFRESLRRILLVSPTDAKMKASQAAAGNGFNKTALVIGGAQWLTAAELLETRELLSSLGLSAPVIVKDLSPGFHIRVPGVTHKPLSPTVTQELSRRNIELRGLATSLGFSALPTFRLSAARYREFHPGKCACHFHTVARRRRGKAGRQGGAEAYEIHGDIHRTCVALLTALLHSAL